VATGGDESMFHRRYLLIALLPTLAFLVNQLLLKYYGDPYDILPDRIAEFDAYKEGAARIGLIGAFLLCFGVAMAGAGFFVASLRIFRTWRESALMVVGFLMLAGAAVLTQQIVIGRPAEEYAGRSLFCLAAGYGEDQSDRARAVEKAAAEAHPGPAQDRQAAGTLRDSPPAAIPPGVAVGHLPAHAHCPYPRFMRMQDLATWQFRVTALAFAGLVFGGIFCLAGPDKAAAPGPSRETAEADHQHWQSQSEWLNASLYLSALLLATNLMFIHAFLRWPGFLLADAQGRDAYVGTMVSYYGIAFSVMLAAYYIPVAVILARKAKKGKGSLPEAFKGPLQVLKIVLGLSSTALAGALPAFLDLVA
jgi:hypothetical protein